MAESNKIGIPNQDTLEALFPPIADYAFLSDCENSCLVAPTGAIEWMCIPKPNDPSIFGTILDRAAGSFRLAPVDSAVPAGHHGARDDVADAQRLVDRE
jgi:GH15 family glucan-1,4-alpha-glucosidase